MVRTIWMWLVIIPFGGGAWVPAVAGLRAHHRPWIVAGVVMFVLALAGFALAGATNDTEYDAWADLGVLMTLLGWFASIGFVFAFRDPYRLRVAARRTTLVADVAWDRSRTEREAALRLAEADPQEALLRGVGRPDVPGARHGHVVDLNHAPARVLTTLPGVDAELAARIVATREEIGLFASVDDACFVLDLPGSTAPRLRRVAVAIAD